MKHLLSTLLLSICFSCQAFDYVIELTSSDPDFEGCEVQLRDRGDDFMLCQSTLTKGKAILKGEIDRNAYASLIVSNHEKRKGAHVFVVLEPDTIIADTKSSNPLKGGELTKKFIETTDYLRSIPISENVDTIIKIIRENPDNGIGEVCLTDYFPSVCSPDQWVDVYSRLPEKTRNLNAVLTVNDRMERMKNTWIGQPFAEIKGKNTDGTEVHLSDYAGKGKYVLIDFWASWCRPCIAAAKEYLLPLYEKYKDNPEFMILGVTIGDSFEASVQAANKHGYPWPQIVDCGMKPMFSYAFNSIPHLILIGPDGKIAARNFTATELESILSKILDN